MNFFFFLLGKGSLSLSSGELSPGGGGSMLGNGDGVLLTLGSVGVRVLLGGSGVLVTGTNGDTLGSGDLICLLKGEARLCLLNDDRERSLSVSVPRSRCGIVGLG